VAWSHQGKPTGKSPTGREKFSKLIKDKIPKNQMKN